MPDVMPRRPGFTTGKEEEVWRGKPALRATVYMWIFSLGLGWAMHFAWQQILTNGAMYSMMSYAPILLQVFYSGQNPKWWLSVIPWLLALFPVVWYTLGLAMTSYTLSTQRLTIKTGILFRTLDQLELFRVRDFLIDAPLYFTILGLGHVRIISRDETLPIVTLIAQPEAEKLINLVRDRVQYRKDEVGMREIETNTA